MHQPSPVYFASVHSNMVKGKRLKLQSKGKKKKGTNLNSEDFQFLLKNTSYNVKDIQDFHEVPISYLPSTTPSFHAGIPVRLS